MAFIIRQIAQTADGREIVRETRSEADAVTVGRAPGNDIHLSDLAVGLHEARLTRDMLSDGMMLRYGSYRVTVSREANDLVLTVRQHSEQDAHAPAFGLSGVAPGKRRWAWALSILVLLLFLAWPIVAHLRAPPPQTPRAALTGFHGDRLWLSGGLSRGHAALAGNCSACHVDAFVSVRDETCTACHKQVHEHAAPVRLAAAGEAGSCASCHVEHEGKVPLSPERQAICSDCHGGLAQRLPDTALRDASDFSDHHPQFRPTVRGRDGAMLRVSIDSRPTEYSGLNFPHKLHLSRTNGVARMAQTLKAEHGFGDALACRDCHRSDSDGAGFRPIEMERDCQMCHSLAFAQTDGVVRMLRHGDAGQALAELRDYYLLNPATAPQFGPVARRKPGAFDFRAATPGPVRASRTIKAVCTECHAVDAAKPVALANRYFAKGWFDHADHKTESCTSCHAADRSGSATDVLMPGLATCRSCHGGEDSASKVPSSCTMCHDYHVTPITAWTPRKSNKGA